VNLVASLIREAARLTGRGRLVHASTQALYVGEDPNEFLHEDSPIGLSMSESITHRNWLEHVLRTYAAKHKLELGCCASGLYGYHSVAGGPGVALQQADGMHGRKGVSSVSIKGVDFIYARILKWDCSRRQPRRCAPNIQSRQRTLTNGETSKAALAKSSRT